MSMDLNDQQRAGCAPSDPADGTHAENDQAREAEENAPCKVWSLKELLTDSGERARTRMDTTGICPTGHHKLDDLTCGGFRPGYTWVIAADTSVGKSSWLVSVADEGIKAGRRILIVSSEDAPQVYGDRLMARRARVDALRLQKRLSNSFELERIAAVVEQAEDVPVYVDAGNKPIEKLEKELRVIIRQEGIDLIAFDYLQEFNSARKHQDERTKYKHIAKVMRWLIKSENKTGAILSQLTVTSDTKVPNRHNIRECRDVGNGAEVIGILFMPENDIPENSSEPTFRAGDRYLLLDKNKSGPRGKKILLDWDDETASFRTVEDLEQKRLEREAREYSDRLSPDGGYDDFS